MNFNENFCFEVANSAIDIEKSIDYLNREDWTSYKEINEQYDGFYGIGLTCDSKSQTPDLDSLMVHQAISRRSKKSDNNWQLMTDHTRHVHGYVAELFSKFKFLPHRARFAKIDAGKKIGMHTDDYMENMTRVHWPIVTNDDNYMLGYNEHTKKIDRYNFKVGHCYAINTNVLHGFINRSSISRIHLIVNFDISFDELKYYTNSGLFT